MFANIDLGLKECSLVENCSTMKVVPSKPLEREMDSDTAADMTGTKDWQIFFFKCFGYNFGFTS